MTCFMVDSRVRGSCPLQHCRQSVLIENEDVVMKETFIIVAHLDDGGCRGLNKCSLFFRNTGDADKPVLLGRRPISALGEVPCANGLTKHQGRQRERRGVAVQNVTSATMLRKKSELTLGSDDFLFLVLALSEYTLDVLIQKKRKDTSQAWMRGRNG